MIYFKLFMTAVCWGGTFVAGRVIAPSVSPFSAAFLRFAIAAVLLAVLAVRAEGRPPRVRWKTVPALIVLGATGVFAYNALFFSGLRLVGAGRASVIIANNPIFIALFSALFFGERLTPVKVTGILLSVTGAVVAISRGDPFSLMTGGLGWGELFIFGCVASWVTYSLVGKHVLRDLSPLVAVAASAWVGTLFLLPPALAEGMIAALPGYRAVDWAALAYLGIFGTVVGFVWYYEGIQRIGAMRAGLFINFVPLSALLLAFAILGEPITGSLLTGALLVIAGVYLTQAGLPLRRAAQPA